MIEPEQIPNLEPRMDDIPKLEDLSAAAPQSEIGETVSPESVDINFNEIAEIVPLIVPPVSELVSNVIAPLASYGLKGDEQKDFVARLSNNKMLESGLKVLNVDTALQKTLQKLLRSLGAVSNGDSVGMKPEHSLLAGVAAIAVAIIFERFGAGVLDQVGLGGLFGNSGQTDSGGVADRGGAGVDGDTQGGIG